MVSFGRSSGDEEVIHILEYICSIDTEFIVYWLEQIVDHCLKCRWGVCKSEVHCYVLVERSARLERDGYDSVVWHVALEACASSTL